MRLSPLQIAALARIVRSLSVLESDPWRSTAGVLSMLGPVAVACGRRDVARCMDALAGDARARAIVDIDHAT